MQGGDERIGRVLSWALAEFIRSRPAPQPLNEPSAESQRGEEAFGQAGCPACHRPPLFTSDRLVGVDEIGTDPAAGLSHVRGTGYYRIPSLRGVGRSAPYLHSGIFESLELMFDPARLDFEPGHPWGLSLSEEERAELVAYLKTICDATLRPSMEPATPTPREQSEAQDARRAKTFLLAALTVTSSWSDRRGAELVTEAGPRLALIAAVIISRLLLDEAEARASVAILKVSVVAPLEAFDDPVATHDAGDADDAELVDVPAAEL